MISCIDENLENCCCINPNYFFNELYSEVVCKNCASIVGNYLCLDERIIDNPNKIHNHPLTLFSTTIDINEYKKYDKDAVFKKWDFAYYDLNIQPRNFSLCLNYLNLLTTNLNETVPEYVKLSAVDYIIKSLKNKMLNGRTLESIVEASLYLAYEINHKKKIIKYFFHYLILINQ